MNERDVKRGRGEIALGERARSRQLVGPAYCCVENCPAPRIRNDVLCAAHKTRERCHDLDAEAERRIAEHRRPWYRHPWQRTAS